MSNGTSPQTQPQGNAPGTAVASMILGIVSLCGGFIPGVNYVTWICAIVAIILGVSARNQIKQQNLSGAGMAMAGIVLGIISLVITVIMIVVVGWIIAAFFRAPIYW